MNNLTLILTLFLLGMSVGINLWGLSYNKTPNQTRFRPQTLNYSTYANYNLQNSLSNLNSLYNNALNYTAEIRVKTGLIPLQPSQFTPLDKISNQSVLGSGVVVDSNGNIITNAHLVKNAALITVQINDKIYKAVKVGEDTYDDIAVIKIHSDNPYCAKFDYSSNTKVGDFVIAIGSPMGLTNTMSLGIISGLNRNINYLKNHVNLIQTDCPISTGNSGGPLINLKGEVIGINTITAFGQKIAFAIPINIALDSYRKIINGGSVQRPYLGMNIENAARINNQPSQLPDDKVTGGVLVTRIIAHGPANQACLAVGDIVIACDNVTTNNVIQLRKYIATKRPGDTIKLKIKRNNSLVESNLTLGIYPSF